MCTCLSKRADAAGHLASCDLRLDPDFDDGYSYWDSEILSLVNEDMLSDERTEDDSEDYDTWLAANDASVLGVTTGAYQNELKPWMQGLFPGTAYAPRCTHYQSPVVLPDGTVIYASGQHHDRMNDPIPDIAVYLDGSWTPDTIAYHIGWHDYGLPTMTADKVLLIASQVLRMARNGKRLEVGCIGGHGRTGTFLAILAMLSKSSLTPGNAIAYVRKQHCHKAIESSSQEWYVRAAHALIHGYPVPRKDYRKPTIKKGGKQTYTIKTKKAKK
jgi:hypothetical protein